MTDELVIIPGERYDAHYHRDGACPSVRSMSDPDRVPLSETDAEPCRTCASEDVDAESVDICPECREPNFQAVTQSNHGYRCRNSDCLVAFDEPGQRTRKRSRVDNRSGLAGKLMQADPDDVSAENAGEPMTDGGQDPLDRLFVEESADRPDEIIVENLTTMDTEEFVARLESLAAAAEAVTTVAEDLQRLRETGFTDGDALNLIYGRNNSLAKRDIKSMFDAIDDVVAGRADRPTERLLSEVSDLNLSKTGELMDELDRLNQRYGGNDDGA